MILRATSENLLPRVAQQSDPFSDETQAARWTSNCLKKKSAPRSGAHPFLLCSAGCVHWYRGSIQPEKNRCDTTILCYSGCRWIFERSANGH